MATFNVEMRQRVSGAFSDIIYPKAHWGNIDGKPSTFAPTAHTHDGYAYAAVNDGTSGLWHYTNSDITSYTNGLAVVLLVNNIAGSSSGTKFEINNLGSYDIYYTNDSKMTTHYGGYTTVILSWEAARSRWYCHDFYDSTDDYGLRWQNNITFGVLTHGYQVLLEGVDGKYYPVTQGGSTGNTNVVSTAAIKPGGKVVYYSSSTDQAANANAGAYYIYESHYNGEMEYWNNRDSGWAIAYRPFYFVFTQNADGSLKLDNSTFTSFMTQTLPTTEDGKLYMQVGIMNNTYDTFRLLIDHPIFEYRDGKLRLWVPPHTHAIADVTGLQTELNAKAASSHTHSYASITDKPSTFAPTAHTHTVSEITDFAHLHDDRYYTQLTVDAKLQLKAAFNHEHGNITNDGKIGTTADQVVVTGTNGVVTVTTRNGIDSRTSFPASAHNHSATDITSGILPLARGGTNRSDGYAVGVVETRASTLIKTWVGTQAQYDAIGTKDANTLYHITE